MVARVETVKELIIINGPPGVGKTTTSMGLFQAMPGSVCIHGDQLRSFAPVDAHHQLGGGSTYRAAAALSLEYLGMGAPRVIFDYVFCRPSHLAHFVDRLGGLTATRLFMFTLWAPLDLVQRRELGRSGRALLGLRVDDCWDEIAANRLVLGEFVDTSTSADTEVTARVLEFLKQGVGRLELSASTAQLPEVDR
jgi:hypothetical protein